MIGCIIQFICIEIMIGSNTSLYEGLLRVWQKFMQYLHMRIVLESFGELLLIFL